MPCRQARAHASFLEHAKESTLLQIIQTMDREKIEDHFTRQSHALLSIRRPGSRFASWFATENQLARCDLMLHEWDVADAPSPLPPVQLSRRQALKIADFVVQNRLLARQLIIQSEFPSSQLTAIAETIGRWAGVPVDRHLVWPDEHPQTRALLESAFDCLKLAEQKKRGSWFQEQTQTFDFTELLGLIVSLTNVAIIHSGQASHCTDIKMMKPLEIDLSLGSSYALETIGYEPALTSSPFFQSSSALHAVLRSRSRRVCRHGGCKNCMRVLSKWKWPVCLSAIFEQKHIPPITPPLTIPGFAWAFVTNREMIQSIVRHAGKDALIEITAHKKKETALMTVGDNLACESLHQVYRSLQSRK